MLVQARWAGIVAFGWLAVPALADGPGDNVVDKVRPIPPRGIALSPATKQELAAGVDALGKEIDSTRKALQGLQPLPDLLPDVQIYHNAVRYALTWGELFSADDVRLARELLAKGRERARLLRQGQAPWTTATGLVARGYVSKIDGSVQPYGLDVPASYTPETPFQHRLDIWFHGRNETLSEVRFLHDCEYNPGPFTPARAFVLYPYGRYCNANHFAGEVDTFEALAHVRKHYPIDENRLVVRGFSMGGAACWHFAVHHAGLWAAAAPGAGFSETPDFLRVFQKETLKPTAYERKLWHLYDCTDYAINLFNCPTVAYSGAKDPQKQAADVMARAMADEGPSLVHIIGPDTGHKYHPAARKEIDRRIDSIVARGRDPLPRRVRFTTWTLRYNRMLWVTVDGLGQHWERARVDAAIEGPSVVKVTTANVTALTLSMPSGLCPLDATRRPTVSLDGREVEAASVLSDRSWQAHFRKGADGWKAVPSASDGTVRKRHGLQGPIDDAFMDRFVMVRPTGKPLNEKVGRWAATEMEHAITHWRQQFRGDAPVKNDTDVSEADIAASNLVLWGDPTSNKVLARIAAKLPIAWDADSVHLGQQRFPADHHVPLLIYPNPLNPRRYVVVNSGFTFREYDYLNNARQVPKLPDYAVLDVDVPATPRRPAGVVTAGFFNEQWQLPKTDRRGNTGDAR
jgi:pimeloyl-ACP methyl ester carboxylesterase